jgi:hypothetical protein
MKSGTTITASDKAIIIVGDPGSRKTTLALHFPRPYFLDCDGNLASPVEQTGIRAFSYSSAVRTDDGTLIHPLDRFQHCIRELNAAAADPNIDTIIIDSLTTFTDIVLSEVRRQEYGATGMTDSAKDIADNKTMRIQDWGKFASLMKNVVTKLRTTNKILVVIAHNNVDKGEADSRYMTFLNVPGQCKNTLSGLFTDCWHTFCDIQGMGAASKHTFCIRTLPISDVDMRGIKTSFPQLKRIATFDEVIAEIRKLKP